MGYMKEIDYEQEKADLKKLLDESEEAREGVSELQAEMAFRRMIINARKASGLTQTEIASRAGMTQQEVSRIEKNGNFTLNTLFNYLNSLGYVLELKKKQ